MNTKVHTEDQRTRFREFCAKLNRFRAFIILNYMAVIKIIKKWNKREDDHKASMDPFAILHSSPFYHSRSLGQLVVKAEMLALCFSPEGPAADRKNFTCPVCWDVLRNPVVLGCAHRFCWSCITQALESSDCCPVCRKRQLLEDGDLEVDVWLAEFVEQHLPPGMALGENSSTTQSTDFDAASVKKKVTVSLPTKSKKALVICISGLRMDVMSFGDLSNIQNSMKVGKYSLAAKVGLPCSGACWATTLTGFREQRHGIAGDKFCKKQMRTPTILRALKLKGLSTAAVSSWRPFNTLVEGDADLSMNYGCDDKVTGAVRQLLADANCPDAIFMHLVAPEIVGKEFGFSPTCKQYMEALEHTDGRIGKLLGQLKQRQEEDWMVVITSDYARVPKVVASSSEPGSSFMVFVNQAVEPGEIIPGPRNIDIAPTLMRFFEQDRECSRLDGRPIPMNAGEEAAYAGQRDDRATKSQTDSSISALCTPTGSTKALSTANPTLSHLETVMVEMENLRMHVNCLNGLLNIPMVHESYQVETALSPPEEFLQELMGKITANAHRIIERVGCLQYDMHLSRSMSRLPTQHAEMSPAGCPPPPSYDVAVAQPVVIPPPFFLPGAGAGAPLPGVYLPPQSPYPLTGEGLSCFPEPLSPSKRYMHNPYCGSDYSSTAASSEVSCSNPSSDCSEICDDDLADTSSVATSHMDSVSLDAASQASARSGSANSDGSMLRSLLGGVIGQLHSNALLTRVSSRATPSPSSSAKRLSIMTFNTWRTEPFDFAKCPAGQPYDRRAGSLEAFFRQHQHVDIFALQEADHVIMTGVQAWLPNHTTVGNGQELCILWNANRFRMLEFGVEVVGPWDPQPLIWARLEWSTGSAFATVLVLNMHMSWPGNPYEVQTACSPRVGQTNDTLAFIAALNRPNEPVLVCGDFNDTYQVPRIFNAAGFRDCFGERNRAAPPTWPSEGACIVHHRGSQTLDWIFTKNNIVAHRVQVVDFRHEGITPSDHLAVYAEYSIHSGSKRGGPQHRGRRRTGSSGSSVDGSSGAQGPRKLRPA
eukprot:GGOE01005950.1.p1 GENE.GGOE01005950.1~~GGOE01005950.1.p1  ORF type:complete len:1120 (-),score=225.69 GGOE01005950.1:754-3888(-)